MGLRDAVKKATSAAIAATGNIAETVNYDSMASATYDVSAGTTGGEGFRYVTSMIFSDKIRDDDGPEHIDGKGLIAQNDLPVRPSIHDEVTRIVDYASTVYEVVPPIKEDPAGAHWSLMLRRK